MSVTTATGVSNTHFTVPTYKSGMLDVQIIY